MLDSEIMERIEVLIKEYENITSGGVTVRTCLANAYNMYWILHEIQQIYKRGTNE